LITLSLAVQPMDAHWWSHLMHLSVAEPSELRIQFRAAPRIKKKHASSLGAVELLFAPYWVTARGGLVADNFNTRAIGDLDSISRDIISANTLSSAGSLATFY
jgi:hypothetical protein